MIIGDEVLRIERTGIGGIPFVMQSEEAPENAAYVGRWSREQHEAALISADVLHALILDAENHNVGFLILRGLTNPNDSIELMRIVVTKKGMGYGTRALSLIVKWCFDVRQAHRLWLDVRVQNVRAQHVYEARGFVREGVLRECVKVGETYQTLHVMSILRGEYEAGLGRLTCEKEGSK